MDPYLETAPLWGDLHRLLMAALQESLSAALADRYRTRTNNRQYGTKVVLFTSVTQESRSEPVIEIHTRTDPRTVTIIDIVSPGNKTSAEGRAAYLATRLAGLRAGANLVEVDLILDGKPTLDYDRSGLPDWNYAVTVTRAGAPDRHEIYTATLNRPLPKFRLPLLADHRDVLVDLHAAFTKAYEAGGFESRVDYKVDPAVPLTDNDRAWLRDLLKQHSLRS
jgi:hypothetical protein